MNGTLSHSISKSQIEKEIEELRLKLPELLQNCSDEFLFGDISESLGFFETKKKKTPNYLNHIPDDFLAVLNKQQNKYKEEIKECQVCSKVFTISKFKEHLGTCKNVKKSQITTQTTSQSSLKQPKKSQTLHFDGSKLNEKKRKTETLNEEEQDKKARKIKKVKPKVSIPTQQTPLTPQFQSKLQPSMNQLQLPTPTRKLAKSPIKSSTNSGGNNGGGLQSNNGSYQSSSYQSVLQSNHVATKTPIYTTPNGPKGSLTPSTIKTSTTPSTTPTNQSPSISINPNISIRQSNQPILINSQSGYPIRSNGNTNPSQSSLGHHSNQPGGNIQHMQRQTQKFTLNPYTQVRKVNYSQPGHGPVQQPHSPHQMNPNTNPLIYKNYHYPTVNQQNMFTTPQYPYQYVYPFSQVPNQNPYYFQHHQMKRSPYQSPHQPVISQPITTSTTSSSPSTLQPSPSPNHLVSNLIPQSNNNGMNNTNDQNIDTSHYFNFASSPPRKSK
eukprot:gene11620-4862_t